MFEIGTLQYIYFSIHTVNKVLTFTFSFRVHIMVKQTIAEYCIGQRQWSYTVLALPNYYKISKLQIYNYLNLSTLFFYHPKPLSFHYAWRHGIGVKNPQPQSLYIFLLSATQKEFRIQLSGS